MEFLLGGSDVRKDLDFEITFRSGLGDTGLVLDFLPRAMRVVVGGLTFLSIWVEARASRGISFCVWRPAIYVINEPIGILLWARRRDPTLLAQPDLIADLSQYRLFSGLPSLLRCSMLLRVLKFR